MDNQDLLRSITIKSDSKIVLIVIDGLGGLQMDGKTELQAAHIPNLDSLASNSICGVLDPILPGITPGSGPAHLSLFGYDPLIYNIGRGVLEALGIGFSLLDGDIAARGNFTTLDNEGRIIDRRAGRLSTQKNKGLCALLDGMKIDGITIIVKPVKEHRVLVVFRGDGLGDGLSDSDPQLDGVAPLEVKPLSEASKTSSRIINRFLDKTKEILKDHHPANMLLLRGFSKLPKIPTFTNLYKLKAACIATYPMYRGIARMVGMEILECGEDIKDEFQVLDKNFQGYDFFYLHIKKTDSMGEDGNFEGKVKILEKIDTFIPFIIALKPDVLVVTGDHSTPSTLRSHSWHPVPVLIHSSYSRVDGTKAFNEIECVSGGLGRIQSIHLMPLILAHAMRLKRYGA